MAEEVYSKQRTHTCRDMSWINFTDDCQTAANIENERRKEYWKMASFGVHNEKIGRHAKIPSKPFIDVQWTERCVKFSSLLRRRSKDDEVANVELDILFDLSLSKMRRKKNWAQRTLIGVRQSTFPVTKLFRFLVLSAEREMEKEWKTSAKTKKTKENSSSFEYFFSFRRWSSNSSSRWCSH